MFVRYYLELPLPASQVEQALVQAPAGWLAGLDAVLELGALGPTRTQLAISARYQPPQDPAGQPTDRFLAHRVAEATLKDLLDQLGHAISLSQPDPAGRISP